MGTLNCCGKRAPENKEGYSPKKKTKSEGEKILRYENTQFKYKAEKKKNYYPEANLKVKRTIKSEHECIYPDLPEKIERKKNSLDLKKDLKYLNGENQMVIEIVEILIEQLFKVIDEKNEEICEVFLNEPNFDPDSEMAYKKVVIKPNQNSKFEIETKSNNLQKNTDFQGKENYFKSNYVIEEDKIFPNENILIISPKPKISDLAEDLQEIRSYNNNICLTGVSVEEKSMNINGGYPIKIFIKEQTENIDHNKDLNKSLEQNKDESINKNQFSSSFSNRMKLFEKTDTPKSNQIKKTSEENKVTSMKHRFDSLSSSSNGKNEFSKTLEGFNSRHTKNNSLFNNENLEKSQAIKKLSFMNNSYSENETSFLTSALKTLKSAEFEVNNKTKFIAKNNPLRKSIKITNIAKLLEDHILNGSNNQKSSIEIESINDNYPDIISSKIINTNLKRKSIRRHFKPL